MSEQNRLPSYFRHRIIALWEEGQNISQITRTLAEEGWPTSRRTVRRWVFRFSTNRGLGDLHRSGRPSVVTWEMALFIESQLEHDDEMTSVEIQRLLERKFSISIISSTVRRYIRLKLQWQVVRTRYGPMISEKNKMKRIEFAQMLMDNQDDFANVIWTDESSVQLCRHSQTMRVKVGKQRILKPAPKHAIKVHVWAGISQKGATKICIFDQIMDGVLYIQILEDFFLPFIATKFPDQDYRFMQDNDPKHTSRVAKEFYEKHQLNWWPTPASSADFNPIERVWHELKHYMARHVKPLTKKELVEGICTFWSTRMTPDKCRRYISTLLLCFLKLLPRRGASQGSDRLFPNNIVLHVVLHF